MIVCCWKYFNNFALLHSVHCAFSIIILYTDIPRYTLSLIGYLFSSNIHDVVIFTMENIMSSNRTVIQGKTPCAASRNNLHDFEWLRCVC